LIFYRNLLDDLMRIDRSYSADCCSPLRAALRKAAARNDCNFLKCQNCGRRWIPSADVDEAAAAWVLIFTTDDPNPIPAAVICVDCEAAHPEPTTMPSIAQLLLSQSRGPIQ
jgi:hypothetical protein